jgi:hypothetical protein
MCDAGQVEDVNLTEMPGLLEAFIKAVPVQTEKKHG